MQSDPKNPADMPDSVDSGAAKTPSPDDGNGRPVGVYVVAAVVGLEALALGLVAVWSILLAFTQPMISVASGVFLIVLLAGLAAGLAAVSVNAYKGMRWTRSAAFVWQLLMVAISVPALLDGNILMGLVLLLPAVTASYYLFTPRVVAFSQRTGAEHTVL
ncbi:hypothetical protein AAGW05_00575 [Arthrobacter sp. LAPM80]|uniref:hypothetical protein n=1 Tax=Arthrobacter sp. LAPM80 TaxID=3141788 RepID=UPI00398AAD0A